jgi:hypothetical protein
MAQTEMKILWKFENEIWKDACGVFLYWLSSHQRLAYNEMILNLFKVVWRLGSLHQQKVISELNVTTKQIWLSFDQSWAFMFCVVMIFPSGDYFHTYIFQHRKNYVNSCTSFQFLKCTEPTLCKRTKALFEFKGKIK